MKSFLYVVLALTMAALAVPAHAGAVTVGSHDSGNCYPFSCFASDSAGSTYQQIYSASEFSGTIAINSVSFHLEIPGLMDSASYRISFSTTSKAVNGLDNTWANNIGADVAVFGVFNVSGLMPSVLTFTGSAFNYDSSMGNLLMQVDVLSLTEPHSYQSFFQADYTGDVTQRMYAYGGSSVGTVGTGALVTTFDYSPAAAVPEPASIAMWGVGALGMAFARRRRNRIAKA